MDAARREFPREVKAADFLTGHGWGLAPWLEVPFVYELMDGGDVDDAIVERYEANNSEYVLYDLRSLANDLDDLISNVAVQLAKAYEENSGNYLLALTNIFTILDHLFTHNADKDISEKRYYATKNQIVEERNSLKGFIDSRY